jgi:hypothetical protein
VGRKNIGKALELWHFLPMAKYWPRVMRLGIFAYWIQGEISQAVTFQSL